MNCVVLQHRVQVRKVTVFYNIGEYDGYLIEKLLNSPLALDA